MRKSFFLTLLLTLCCTLTAWANTTTFKPDSDKAYALKVKDTNPALFLDIQSNTDDTKVRLSNSPCAIYFSESKDYPNCWDIKDKNNNYVYFANGTNYPQTGANSQQQCWVFTETNNAYTINAWDCYLYGEKINGAIVYIQYQYSYPLEFTLEEFVEQTQKTYTLNIKGAPAGASVTYNGQTVANGETITIKGTVDVSLFDATDIEGYTWSVAVDGPDIILTYTEIINGYYYINYNGTPLFISYNEDKDDNGQDTADPVGYKLIATNNAEAEGDKIFAIIPNKNEDTYTISAQGKYLKSPNVNWWNHVMFSDNGDEAGKYVFQEAEGLYKIKGITPNADEWTRNYLQIYQKFSIVANNTSAAASNFTLTRVTTYPVSEGLTALCLPFNVILPEGVVAYDITNATEATLKSKEGLFNEIANSGNILQAGTPVILNANAATSLTITMDSNGAKTSSNNSLLRGNFVKQTLEAGSTKKYILQSGKFKAITANTQIPANSCWVETTIKDENANQDLPDNHIIIDGWEFEYTEKAEGRITLGNCVNKDDQNFAGNPELTIGSNYIVKGEEKTVTAISRDFLEGNTKLQSIRFPATMTNLGFRETVHMFDAEYEGQEGDGINKNENGTTQGMNRCLVFPEDRVTGQPYVVDKSSAWRLTLDVTIDKDNLSFNQWGSAIVSTKENSLDDSYQKYMQIYMWKDLQHIVVKIDNADDRYAYSTPALDEAGNETGQLLVNKHFTFELEHDGSGGYQVVIYYDNGKAKIYNITATEGHEVQAFDRLYYSLPEGIHVKVKFDKLITHGLFVGCTNLTEIKVDPNNPTFKSCEHGVLYDKHGYYVMRIPEGETSHHFEIPSKVVKLYPGAVHGVNTDIVLHSNPEIGVVTGHEEDVKDAKFYLSLDDIDATIAKDETGYGGARDFNSSNLNRYQSARYKRAPLAKGAYGTITLPFVPTNATKKYDFFKFTGGSADALHFTQVETLEANTPYLYKLKEKPEAITSEDGKDVFETTEPFTIEYKDKYYPNEAPGTYNAVGTYTNFYVETNQAATSKSAYYYYSIGKEAFLKVTQKLNYRPYRTFFVVTPEEGQENQANQAPATLSLRLIDGSTQVIAPSQVEGWEETRYYDLMGRRVMNPTNGIYIVNGKKVVIE